MIALEAVGLGKRYRRAWALRDCSLTIPQGRIVALVGPNGAGKTTLLHCAVGLAAPTIGSLVILDGLAPGSSEALESVAFVAQDAPLHRWLSVQAMFEVAECLNTRFDSAVAHRRLDELGIDLKTKVGRLSGGQQAQLALTIALARRPRMLLLDEPLARLDPLARHDFMRLLMSGVAEEQLSVVLSSHVIAELERVADYLILLNGGRVQVAEEVEQLLEHHSIWTGPRESAEEVARAIPVVSARRSGRRAELLVRADKSSVVPSGWESDEVGLEELVLAYLRQPNAAALPGPVAIAANLAEDALR